MIKNNFQLDRKYLYINTELGCDMVSTSGESYHVPMGYWCFLIDEVKDYFTTSYVDFVVNDFDSSFKVETRDFLIHNLQTPFDLNVSSFINTIGNISHSLNSIDDYCRIMQNSLSMLLNSSLQNNPINNVGSLNLSKRGDGDFVAYVPVIKKNFGGTLILQDCIKFSNVPSSLGSWSVSSTVPWFSCCIESYDRNLGIVRRSYKTNLSDYNYKLDVMNSDGLRYENVVFGNPVVKTLGVRGRCFVPQVVNCPISSDSNFDSYVSLNTGEFFKVEASLTGFVFSGTGNVVTEDYSVVSVSGGLDYTAESNLVVEIPFTVIVPPESSANENV